MFAWLPEQTDGLILPAQVCPPYMKTWASKRLPGVVVFRQCQQLQLQKSGRSQNSQNKEIINDSHGYNV